MAEVYLKMQTVRRERLVAICDEELLGRKIEDKQRGINFDVKEIFFKGSKIRLDEALPYLERASIANMVGARIVGKAVEAGFIDPSAVIEIAGIPHAQLIKMWL